MFTKTNPILYHTLILSLSPPFFTSWKCTVVRESRQGLPFTISPEYMAAQRAYMRYHNMNPIFGISSKEARAADEAH